MNIFDTDILHVRSTELIPIHFPPSCHPALPGCKLFLQLPPDPTRWKSTSHDVQRNPLGSSRAAETPVSQFLWGFGLQKS